MTAFEVNPVDRDTNSGNWGVVNGYEYTRIGLNNFSLIRETTNKFKQFGQNEPQFQRVSWIEWTGLVV